MTIYISKNFEDPVLTKVEGQMDCTTLKLNKDQLKANASSELSAQGVGANGYLGLIITPN